jgi:hypothetical protein
MFKKKPNTPKRQREPYYKGSRKVFSYYSNRTIDNANQNRAKGSRREDSTSDRWNERSTWAHVPAYIAGFVILFCVAYNLILSNNPRVIVEGKAGERLLLDEAEVYQMSAKNVLSNSVFNRSKLTIQAEKIDAQLTKMHPELSSVEVTLPLIGQRPIVYIKPAVPFMMLTATTGQQYVLDKTGKVISDTADSAPSEILALQDSSGLQFDIGEQALSSKDIKFVYELRRQFEAKEVSITSVELPEASQSLRVRIQGAPYYVTLSFQEDVRMQAGAFLASYARMNRDGVKPKSYVDVRVGDKVYIK